MRKLASRIRELDITTVVTADADLQEIDLADPVAAADEQAAKGYVRKGGWGGRRKGAGRKPAVAQCE